LISTNYYFSGAVNIAPTRVSLEAAKAGQNKASTKYLQVAPDVETTDKKKKSARQITHAIISKITYKNIKARKKKGLVSNRIKTQKDTNY
jgi:hypothetical protein